jgi:hypothetical protein
VPSADDKPIAATAKPAALPAGTPVKTDPNKWYYLKANYINDERKQTVPATGYAYPVAKNAATSFWDYVVFQSGPPTAGVLRIQPRPAEAGWFHWRFHNDQYNEDYHLECKATGFLYRTNLYNTWWQIVDRKLYCSYWTTGVPAGSSFRKFLVPDGQYLGMGLTAFTCDLEEVP